MSLTDQPHRHTFYEILYYTAGRGTHFIDFSAYPCRPPVLYFISPGQVHFWDQMEAGKGYVLLFIEDFLVDAAADHHFIYELAFFHNALEKPELQLTTDQQAALDGIIHPLVAEHDANRFGRSNMLHAYLRILLVKVQRMYALNNVAREKPPESALVRHFKQLVVKSRGYQRPIQYYADHLGVGAASLSKRIKAATGQTPGQLIRHEIALEAKRLLVHTSMSAAEIGYRLGFEDPSYFGRFFKRETGHRPTHFRRQAKEKYQKIPTQSLD